MKPNTLSVRAFLMAFTSAFLCFLLVWMAALMLIHPKTDLPSPIVSSGNSSSVYLPDTSDCMTLLVCEESPSPSLFFLLRFDPVEGQISIFAFPDRLNLSLSQVTEPALKIYQANGISGISQALAETYGIAPERYIRVSRTALPQLFALFGTTQIELSSDLPLVIDGIRITLTQGLQLLDGERLFCWLQKEAPSSSVEQCRFFSEFLTLCINQHRSFLLEENSTAIFTEIVNLTDTDLIFSDFDSRKKAADLLGQLSSQPAQPFLPDWVQNADATLSLSTEDREQLCALFCSDTLQTLS